MEILYKKKVLLTTVPHMRIRIIVKVIPILVIMGLLLLVPNCTLMIHHNNVSNRIPLEMVLVEGGIFTMGDRWHYTDTDALPAHSVELDSFYLSKYEITVGEYERYAKSAGITYIAQEAKDYPVTDIDWDEARAFCEWYGYRLPTESEWEYAARSGGKPERYSGADDIGDIDLYAVHLYNSNERPHPVGSKNPNALGLYDMSGNVYEWIGLYYAQYQYGKNGEFIDFNVTNMRIIRGGCFSTSPIKTYQRAAAFRDQKSPRIGFRCAQSINHQQEDFSNGN